MQITAAVKRARKLDKPNVASEAKLMRGVSGLLRDTVLASGLRLAGMTIALATSIFLARTFGPQAFGLYTFVFTIVVLLEPLAGLGTQALATRNTARLRKASRDEHVRELRMRLLMIVLLASALIVVVMLAAMALPSVQELFVDPVVMLVALALLPVSQVLTLHTGFLSGESRVKQAQFVSNICRPGAFLAAAIVLAWVWPEKMTPASAFVLHIFAAGLAVAVCFALLPQAVRREGAERDDSHNFQALVIAGIPFAAMTGLQYLQTRIDVLVIGVMREAADVGIYQVATRTSTLVQLPGSMVAALLAPKFAAFVGNDIAARRSELANGTVIALALTLPIVVFLLAFADSFIELLYGSAYLDAHLPLLILILAQAVFVSASAATSALTMGGQERYIVKVIIFTALLNLVLNVLTVPHYGLVGAAMSTTVCGLVSTAMIVARLRTAKLI